jgi:hypothetical protein
MARRTSPEAAAERLRAILRANGADAKARAAASRVAEQARTREVTRTKTGTAIDPESFGALLAELLAIGTEARIHPLGGGAHARRVLSNAIRICDAERLDPLDAAALLLAAASTEIGRYGIVRDLVSADHAAIGAASLAALGPSITALVPANVIETAVAAVAAHEDDGGAKIGEIATHLRWSERLDGLGAHGLLRLVGAAMIDETASANVIAPDRAASPAAGWWRETTGTATSGYTYAEKQAAKLREWGIELIAATRALEPASPSEGEVAELLGRIESLEPAGRTREGIALLFTRANKRAAAGWFALLGGAVDAALVGGRSRTRALTRIAKEGEPLSGAAARVLLAGSGR